jgi:hypothetical protein
MKLEGGWHLADMSAKCYIYLQVYRHYRKTIGTTEIA